MKIGVLNLSTKVAIDLPKLIETCNQAIVEDFGPIWQKQATLISVLAVTDPCDMLIILTNSADVANALGYHDLVHGKPTSHVFVVDSGNQLDVTFSHELFEMILDPPATMWVTNPTTRNLEAFEASDAVEETFYTKNGFNISNFVTPTYFGMDQGLKTNFMNLILKPFGLLSGGYKIVMHGGRISQAFGSLQKHTRFAAEDRRLHRSEFRKQKCLSNTN